MGITLVATDWSGKVPGFDAEQAADCAFMHDPAVRRWITEQRGKGTPDDPARIIVADDEWVNPGGVESLTFPVDPRDMAAVEEVRRELKPPPHRTEGQGGAGPRGASYANGPLEPRSLRDLPRTETIFNLLEPRPYQ